jgi:hypothetical protein
MILYRFGHEGNSFFAAVLDIPENTYFIPAKKWIRGRLFVCIFQIHNFLNYQLIPHIVRFEGLMVVRIMMLWVLVLCILVCTL